jgi:hypothetical protein
MKNMFAGNIPQMNSPPLKLAMRDHVLKITDTYNRLLSFEYRREAETVLETLAGDERVAITLDSGAFSAYRQNIEIHIDDYIAFVHENKKHLVSYVNLDVINDGERSLQNYHIMRSNSLDPVPVWHTQTSLRYLLDYLKHTDYIGIGAIANMNNSKRLKYLDDLFSNYLTDDNGMPIAKFHGFGLGSREIIARYPWYSVDSTTWVEYSKNGIVLIPPYKNGQNTYDEDPWKVNVTFRGKTPHKHLLTAPARERQIILRYLDDKGFKIGKSRIRQANTGPKEMLEETVEEGISNTLELRDRLNATYYVGLEKHLRERDSYFKSKKAANARHL